MRFTCLSYGLMALAALASSSFTSAQRNTWSLSPGPSSLKLNFFAREGPIEFVVQGDFRITTADSYNTPQLGFDRTQILYRDVNSASSWNLLPMDRYQGPFFQTPRSTDSKTVDIQFGFNLVSTQRTQTIYPRIVFNFEWIQNAKQFNFYAHDPIQNMVKVCKADANAGARIQEC